jgi:hypothetical protein
MYNAAAALPTVNAVISNCSSDSPVQKCGSSFDMLCCAGPLLQLALVVLAITTLTEWPLIGLVQVIANHKVSVIGLCLG